MDERFYQAQEFPAPLLTKAIQKIDREESEPGELCVYFSRDYEDYAGIATRVTMDVEVWHSMGSPEWISVVIEPGDIL